MSFHSPIAFAFLAFLLLIAGAHRSDTSAALAASTMLPLGKIPSTLRSKLFRPVMTGLLGACFICLVIALARPQRISEIIESQASGRDLMLVLDTSGSMRALDFFLQGDRVDRITALKSVTVSFIEGRVGDRMGLIIFGDHAFTQCPLTLDLNVLKGFVENLEVGMAGQGTAIGDALGVALKRIRDIDAESKTIILVTDGKNTSGTLGTTQSAELARTLGIKVHAIGIGGNEVAPFPIVDQLGRERIIHRQLEYDEKALREIAELTGGSYFNAKDTSGLQQIYAQLNELEKRDETTLQYFQYQELFVPFAIAALLLLLLHELLAATIFLRIP